MPASSAQGSLQALQVPEFDRIGAAAGNHRLSVTRNGQARHRALVLSANLPASVRNAHIPETDLLVPSATRKCAAIGRKGKRKHGIVVALVNAHEFSRVNLDELNLSVLVAKGCNAPIR